MRFSEENEDAVGRTLMKQFAFLVTWLLAPLAAFSAGAATPLGKHAQELYRAFDAAGNGGVDFSGIIQHVRGLAGSE